MTTPHHHRLHRLRLLLVLVLLPLMAGACRSSEAAEAERKPAFVSYVDALYGPESVKYDPEQDAFLISNMLGFGSAKDGAGYILRVRAEDLGGGVILVESGKNGAVLNAPKGMAIHGDTLWVADIDALRGFDRRSGMPLATTDFAPHGAVMLNDVTVGGDGALYVTDTGIEMGPAGAIYRGGDRIFRVGPGGAVSVVAQGPELGQPNGIAWDAAGKRLVVVSFRPFHSEVYAFVPGQAKRTLLLRGKGRFDGLEVLPDGRLLVTAWSDQSLHLVGNGRDERIVVGLSWPADLGYDSRRNRVAIPQVMLNRVDLWQLPAE